MPWSARDEHVAESLLRFMRDPAGMLDSVSESIEIGNRELRREITLRLKPDALGTEKWAYLDVLHPRKGGAAEIRVESPDAVARVASHTDHLAVSVIAIQVRFLTVWRSAIVPAAHQAAFRSEMMAAFRDLARLPEVSESDARKIVDLHFDYGSGILRAIRAAPGTVIDATRMNGLFELCKRLQSRYLVLLKVGVEALSSGSIVFSYPTAVDEYDVRKSGNQQPRPLPRHLSQATPPGSFRLHVPWAKRTDHYELHLDAPEGYFFSRQVLLAGTGRRTVVIPEASPAMWSINTGQGRHSTMFLGSARLESTSIHAGIQSLEIPGRSTSRAFMLGLFVTMSLLGFTLLSEFTVGSIMPTASLMVGLLAIGAFVVTPSDGPGVLGYPLLSRFAPAALAVTSVVFIFWLASRDAVPGFHLAHDPVAEALRAIWATWCIAGGWLLVAVAVVVTIRMGARRRSLIRNFRDAVLRANPRSHNFF